MTRNELLNEILTEREKKKITFHPSSNRKEIELNFHYIFQDIFEGLEAIENDKEFHRHVYFLFQDFLSFYKDQFLVESQLKINR